MGIDKRETLKEANLSQLIKHDTRLTVVFMSFTIF